MNLRDDLCLVCLRDLSQVKPNLTPETLIQIINDQIKTCETYTDIVKRDNCLLLARIYKQLLEYLLSHSPEETCILFGLCKSDDDLKVGSTVQPSYIRLDNRSNSNNLEQDSQMSKECKACIKFAESMKDLMTPKALETFAKKDTELCQQIRDDAKRKECLEKVGQYIQQSNYLMAHTPEEFCTFVGTCP